MQLCIHGYYVKTLTAFNIDSRKKKTFSFKILFCLITLDDFSRKKSYFFCLKFYIPLNFSQLCKKLYRIKFALYYLVVARLLSCSFFLIEKFKARKN